MQDYSHLNQFGSLVRDFEYLEANYVDDLPSPEDQPGVTPSNVRAAYRAFRTGLLRAQRFIIPEAGTAFIGDDVHFDEKYLDLVYLPFPEVAVLYEQEGESRPFPGVALFQKVEGSERAIKCSLAFRGEQYWGLFNDGFLADPSIAEKRYFRGLHVEFINVFDATGSPPIEDDVSVLQVFRAGSVLVDLCCALACSNVNARAIKVDERTSARRARAGKRPLFSYKVLELKANSNFNKDHVGGGMGERVSPRTHLRRGHIRRLGDGRIIWVNAAMVRGKTPGIVVKDYRLER